MDTMWTRRLEHERGRKRVKLRFDLLDKFIPCFINSYRWWHKTNSYVSKSLYVHCSCSSPGSRPANNTLDDTLEYTHKPSCRCVDVCTPRWSCIHNPHNLWEYPYRHCGAWRTRQRVDILLSLLSIITEPIESVFIWICGYAWKSTTHPLSM